MRIKSIRYWKEDMALTRPYTITYVVHDSIENIFIQIVCEDGTYGLGAGSPSVYVTGEEMDSDFSAKQDVLADWIVGRDIRTYKNIIDLLAINLTNQPALLAALDMALHDAFTKYIGVSLHEYLGINIKPLPTSITIGIKNVQETIEEGLEYQDRGFKAIKLKIGNELEEDIERYLKLREAVDQNIKIRVDANQGFDAAQFMQFIDRTKDVPVEFFEQPMKPKSYAAMRALPEHVRMNCAGDEDVQKLTEAVYLAQQPYCFGIYNIKIMKCGGITEAIRIADVAKTQSIKLMWGCMDESRISIAASLIAAMRCTNTEYLDLDGSLDLSRDIVHGGFDIQEGIMYPMINKKGLGVELID